MSLFHNQGIEIATLGDSPGGVAEELRRIPASGLKVRCDRTPHAVKFVVPIRGETRFRQELPVSVPDCEDGEIDLQDFRTTDKLPEFGGDS